MNKRLQQGLSLIELMVALVIGSVMISGAVYVYVQSRNSFAVNETAARLQEAGRFALSVMEPDIRMSNYWGLVKGATVITDQATQAQSSLGNPTGCGNNFAHDLMTNLAGTDNAYSLGCAAYGAGAVASADTITVRRASTATAVSTANTLQICSTRLTGRLYSDGSTCTSPPFGQVNNLVVDAYYVGRDSDHLATLPALRRKTLIGVGMTGCSPVPCFRDDEIVPGVEDLQVQFGIDQSGTSGVATQYVNPGTVPTSAQVVAVRIWLLIRAEAPEVGFKDTNTYEYGDRTVGGGTTGDLNATGAARKAYKPDDNFRRLLISRTIQVRNALGT